MTQKESEKNIHAVFITDEFFYSPHFPHSPHSQNRVNFSSQNKHPTLGAYLKTIQNYLLNNTICLPRTLLSLYLQILQQGEVSTNQSREKEELMNLGLVIEQENKLKVSNCIYQSILAD